MTNRQIILVSRRRLKVTDLMNEETESLDDTLVTIKGDVFDLTNGKVSIMEDADTYKSTYQVLKEISAVWDELTDKQQAQLLDKLFGKNIFALYGRKSIVA